MAEQGECAVDYETNHQNGSLWAGAAEVEITPPPGTHLAGRADGGRRPAEVVLDPLYAKAVVLVCGARKICFLALDATIVTQGWTDQIRQASAERWGFDPDAVMVHATQTHSAPSLGYFMVDQDFPDLGADVEYLRGGERAYGELTAHRALAAIDRAQADLKPVRAAVGSAVVDGIAFNRRAITRDGKAVMPWFYSSRDKPLGPIEIRYIEGPIDPEVGVFCVRDEQLAIQAMLLHYTCHPVNVYALPGNAVSADWPGAWAAAMRGAFGGACVPLVLNGCCGNINPWPAFTPDFTPDHRRMGNVLAERASAVIREMHFSEVHHLDWRVRHVPLALKPPDPERVSRAERMLAENPEPLWSSERPGTIDPQWYQAASIHSVELMRRRSPSLRYEIQAFRVGDTAFVGLAGEPFVEGQLAIKIASPTAYTFLAHATTHYVGYVPTRGAHERGGHEIDFSYWAKLAPDALETVTDNATDMLREMF
jgi:hypothetical protein